MSIIICCIIFVIVIVGMMMFVVIGCVVGENVKVDDDNDVVVSGEWLFDMLFIDFVIYNLLSFVICDQGIFEEIFGDDVEVEWIQFVGFNKVNELL